MRIGNWAPGIRVHGSLGIMVMAAASCMCVAAAEQVETKRKIQQKEKGWRLSVISEALPGKVGTKLRLNIEENQIVCRSEGSAVLEIPLQAISQVSRDTDKDYPASRFLMAAATRPSEKRHRFGSKAHREELEARAGLVMLSFLASLFPTHKELVRVTWTDEGAAHDADLYLGRTEGQALLAEIKKQTGLEVRDLEKERKEMEKEIKALQRKTGEKSKENSKEKPKDETVPIL